MPIDVILLAAAVVSMFAIFAAGLLWGDLKSRSVLQVEELQQGPYGKKRRRRSF